MEDVAPPKDK